MVNKRLVYILLLIFVFILKNLESQQQKPLTIEDCIQFGMENNRTLKIDKSKIASADEKLSEINSGRLPSLKFIAGYTRLSAIDPFTISMPVGQGKTQEYTISPALLDNYTMKMSLQQPVFTGFRLESNADLNKYNLLASSEDLKKDKSLLVLDIKNAYWNYIKAMELVNVVNENIAQTKAHLEDIQNFFNRGLATNNDVLKVKVQLSNVQLLKVDADNTVKLAMMGLNNIIGLPISSDTKIVTEHKYNETRLPDLENLLEEGLKSRPELKGMDLRIKAGESGVKLAQAGWYPQINFAANYNYMRPNPRIMPSKDQFIGTWDVGINLSFDVWNWLTTEHQTAQATETLEQTKYSLLQLKDAVILDVSQSYLNLSKSKEKISVSEYAVRQAEENYRVVNEKFKSGIALNSDLIDAESALLQAKVNLISAVADFEIAMAKLDKSVGR